MTAPLTRRSLLLGATALAGTAALAGATALPPSFAEVMAEKAVADQAAARLPAWVVGTPGDFDGQVIRAATEEDAIAEWLDDMWIQCECGDVLDSGEVIGPEDCYRCTHSVEAERSTYFDDIDKPKAGDWLRAGHCAYCTRCGEATCDEWTGHAIGDEAETMTDITEILLVKRTCSVCDGNGFKTDGRQLDGVEHLAFPGDRA